MAPAKEDPLHYLPRGDRRVWARALAVVLATVGAALAVLAGFAGGSFATGSPKSKPILYGIVVALVIVAIGNWWAVIVIARAFRRHPRVIGAWLQYFLFVAIGASCLALCGLNALPQIDLPDIVSYSFLVAGILMLCLPGPVFLARYYSGP
jgi:uncharacterized protein YneF (UPF0154 family)